MRGRRCKRILVLLTGILFLLTAACQATPEGVGSAGDGRQYAGGAGARRRVVGIRRAPGRRCRV